VKSEKFKTAVGEPHDYSHSDAEKSLSLSTPPSSGETATGLLVKRDPAGLHATLSHAESERQLTWSLPEIQEIDRLSSKIDEIKE